MRRPGWLLTAALGALSLLLLAVYPVLAVPPPHANARPKPPKSTTTTVAATTTTTVAPTTTTEPMPTTTTIVIGDGVPLTPTSDVQAALDANPPGTTFSFAPGIYRPVSVNGYNPKQGQRLLGRGLGVVLSGAKVLPASGGWTVAGATWWAAAFLPGTAPTHGECLADGAGGLCTQRHDVFRDGVRLTRVATQGAVVAGTFWSDYTNNRVYVGDDPNTHLLEQAWTNHTIMSTNDNITVQNFTIEKSAVEAQQGAVSARGDNWTVAYNDIGWNQGAGLEVGPSGVSNRGTFAHHNRIHHNGQMGVVGSGDHHTIELNEIDHNNSKDYHYGWEAGGLKTGEDTWYDGIIRGNYVHDNKGPGLWQDVAAGTTDTDGNYVRDNIVGIMFEISYGTRPASAGGGGITYIRNNIVIHNIDPNPPGTESSFGIVNHASPDVEVYGNQVYDERACIMGFQQDRPTPVDARGAHEIKNFNVHDNFCDMNGTDPNWTGKVGLWTDVGAPLSTDLYSAGYNNHWENNDYRHSNAAISWFDWSTSFRNFTQWQAFPAGHDDTGSITAGSALTPPSPPTLTVGPQP